MKLQNGFFIETFAKLLKFHHNYISNWNMLNIRNCVVYNKEKRPVKLKDFVHSLFTKHLYQVNSLINLKFKYC